MEQNTEKTYENNINFIYTTQIYQEYLKTINTHFNYIFREIVSSCNLDLTRIDFSVEHGVLNPRIISFTLEVKSTDDFELHSSILKYNEGYNDIQISCFHKQISFSTKNENTNNFSSYSNSLDKLISKLIKFINKR